MDKVEEINIECNKMWDETRPKDRRIFVTHLVEAKKQIEELNNKIKEKDLKSQEQLEQKNKEKEKLQLQLIEKDKLLKQTKEELETEKKRIPENIDKNLLQIINDKDNLIKKLSSDNVVLNALLKSLSSINKKSMARIIVNEVVNEIKSKAQYIQGTNNNIYCINLLEILSLIGGE